MARVERCEVAKDVNASADAKYLGLCLWRMKGE